MAKTYLKPISIPSDTDLSLEGSELIAKGKLGELSIEIHSDVNVTLDKENISFSPKNDQPETAALTGTMRALSNNLVKGVSEGFERKLEINGVGYRAKLSGEKLELSLGFSHPVVYFTNRNPLFYCLGVDYRRNCRDIWVDIAEDGLNGNEELYTLSTPSLGVR